MIRNLVLVVTAFLLYSSSIAAYAVSVDRERAVVIEGVIEGQTLAPVAQEISKRAARGDTDVDLIINSPGGSVIAGFLFINLMEAAKQKGMKFRCFVPEFAASMAFGILTHCNERHALSRSLLLWHRARVMVGGFMGSPMTAPQAFVLASDLDSIDRLILEETQNALGEDMSARDVSYHFENETLHVGSNLHRLAPLFITTHTAIEGLYEALDDKEVPRSAPSRGPFGDFEGFEPGEIIYIREQLVK